MDAVNVSIPPRFPPPTLFMIVIFVNIGSTVAQVQKVYTPAPTPGGGLSPTALLCVHSCQLCSGQSARTGLCHPCPEMPVRSRRPLCRCSCYQRPLPEAGLQRDGAHCLLGLVLSCSGLRHVGASAKVTLYTCGQTAGARQGSLCGPSVLGCPCPLSTFVGSTSSCGTAGAVVRRKEARLRVILSKFPPALGLGFSGSPRLWLGCVTF